MRMQELPQKGLPGRYLGLFFSADSSDILLVCLPLSGTAQTCQDNVWWEHLLLKVQDGSQSCYGSQANRGGLSGKGGFPQTSGK